MGRSLTAQKSGPRDAATKVAQHRLSVLELARELGNVAEACRQRGLDRTALHVLSVGPERPAVSLVGGDHAQLPVEQQDRLAQGIHDGLGHGTPVVAVRERLTIRPPKGDVRMTVRYRVRRFHLHILPERGIKNGAPRSRSAAACPIPLDWAHSYWPGRRRRPGHSTRTSLYSSQQHLSKAHGAPRQQQPMPPPEGWLCKIAHIGNRRDFLP